MVNMIAKSAPVKAMVGDVTGAGVAGGVVAGVTVAPEVMGA
jgi:hypothetical protein